MKVKLKGCFCSLEHCPLFQRFFVVVVAVFALRQFWTENSPKAAHLNNINSCNLVVVLSGTSGPYFTFSTITEGTEVAGPLKDNFRREKSCITGSALTVTSQTHNISSCCSFCKHPKERTPGVSPPCCRLAATFIFHKFMQLEKLLGFIL